MTPWSTKSNHKLESSFIYILKTSPNEITKIRYGNVGKKTWIIGIISVTKMLNVWKSRYYFLGDVRRRRFFQIMIHLLLTIYILLLRLNFKLLPVERKNSLKPVLNDLSIQGIMFHNSFLWWSCKVAIEVQLGQNFPLEFIDKRGEVWAV